MLAIWHNSPMPAQHPNWFDLLTVAAIFIGPVAALFTQRMLDELREKKRRRLDIYRTLMSLRATPLDPAHVRALNSIDAIFDGNGKDEDVRERWGRLLAHVSSGDASSDAWNTTLVDLRVDLYQAIAKAVGYDHSVEYLKTRIYFPSLYEHAERDIINIRQNLATALSPAGLKVLISEPRVSLESPVGQDRAEAAGREH